LCYQIDNFAGFLWPAFQAHLEPYIRPVARRDGRERTWPQRPEAAGIILTAPGEEAQVDYGSGPMVRDPQTGKYRRTRLFVLTLGYSRKSVRLLAWRSSARERQARKQV
jgi:hypothetical protein